MRSLLGFLILASSIATYLYLSSQLGFEGPQPKVLPWDANSILANCRSLSLRPGPPVDFHAREQSDRFQPGTTPVVIRNATIWTGEGDGLQTLCGDVLLDKGIIKFMGNIPAYTLASYGSDIHVIEAHGSWLTPGVVDLHSHLGAGPAPMLNGANDGNSWNGPILPWLRVLDGLNTHDDGYLNSISGGVTTSLVLPGSLNAIGGQGLVMKLRPTRDRSPTSMLLEPPPGFNGSEHDFKNSAHHWGHMKHACGENPRSYGDVRMDTVWKVRQAYDTARSIKNAQDDYCAKALAGDWRAIANQEFPQSLQWASLVDVLRGKIKVQTHCYEALDIDNFVRLSHEFQFEVAAFHHAHEAYLVPDVLKRAYGKPPALAMFSTFARYKRESYRHSEYAPRVLHDEGLDVVMKSDHSAVPSRLLIGEAAIAHYYDLPENVALASVISTPARILGLDHRIGYIREGFDADIVLWDSHPLALGATPKQVIIDGILQFPDAHTLPKPVAHQRPPNTPGFEKETAETLKYDGLPPLKSKPHHNVVAFTNVSSFWTPDRSGSISDLFSKQLSPAREEGTGVVIVSNGKIVCSSSSGACNQHFHTETTSIDLQGGAIQPGLVNYGAALGLTEIAMEPSTGDGAVADPLDGGQPALFGAGGYLAKAADGLMFGTRDALLAYRSGVTVSVTAPIHDAWLGGLSVAFSVGAPHKLANGAILHDAAAVHCSLSHGDSAPSVSTKIAAMRRLLTGKVEGEIGEWFAKVAQGAIPLVVNVGSADIMASLVSLKKETELKNGTPLKLTLAGATEAHIIAEELAEAGVGVIVTPTRSFPYTWDERRILPGPPITEDSLISYLLRHNVTVGVGPRGVGPLGHPDSAEMTNSRARNLRFDVGEAMYDAMLSKEAAFELATVNVEKLLGLDTDAEERDLVATAGGDLLGYEGKVIAVISPRRKIVDIF